MSNESWNQIVAYLTAGLLYGREVPRPDWFTKDRKRPYKPRPGFPPARRRQQVLDALLKGHTPQRICSDLDMKPGALTQHLDKIYKSEAVHSHRQLLRKHHLPIPAHLTSMPDRILARLQSGILPDEIAKEFHIQLSTVHRHIRTLRHKNKLAQRRPYQTPGQSAAANAGATS